MEIIKIIKITDYFLAPRIEIIKIIKITVF